MNCLSFIDLDGKRQKIWMFLKATTKISKCEVCPGLLEMTKKAQSRQEFIKPSKLKTWSPKKEKKKCQPGSKCLQDIYLTKD